MISQTISHYKILEKLGEGGMGVVYKAEDMKLHRPVALKLLPRQALVTEEDKTRFAREAEAAASLSHPNVAMIFEFDEVDDPVTGGKLAFIAMEYVDGETVKQKIKERPLPIDEALRIAIAVSEGLAEAHGKGTIHRDIKSDNIMISRSGVVKIMDFGLAEVAGRTRVTKAGMTVGTAAYMSPEQAQGEKLDQRTDIWSLGVVLYEMITGRLPFAGDYEQAIVYRILNEEPEPITSLRSNVPMELERIVRKAMRKDRASRYQRMEDVLVDLEGVRGETGSRPSGARAIKPSLRKKIPVLLLGGIAVLVILVVLAVYLFFPSKPATVESMSIAVLPFQNFSNDEKGEYFSDGMTESIITDIAQVPGLLVISRNSVFQYKGKSVDVQEVGKELNVRYILEGSVQRSGDILRVNVQLVETLTGFHVWANKFDRKMKDVFAVQDDISRNIIKAMRLALSKEKEHISGLPPTENLEAYDHYLRGRFFSNRGGRAYTESARAYSDSAIAMLEKATSLDPQFALAYAALAKAYNTIFFLYDANLQWEQKAYVAIERALSLNPSLAEVYSVRGDLAWTLANGFPHERAIKEYRHALELNPNLLEAHEGLGSVYLHIGLFDKALAELHSAMALDPTSRFSPPRIARIHWYQQKYDTALAELEKIEQPGWLRERALVLWYLGRKNEAFETIKRLEIKAQSGIEQADFAAGYAVLLAGAGLRKEAEEKIHLAVKLGQGISHFHHAEHLIASAYALIGNPAAAVEWLKNAADHGLPCYPLFVTDPNLESLKSNPEFISFMEKLRKQWEQYKATL